MNIKELGCPGHLIVAGHCRFRRHTQIGAAFRISTVGDYFPPNSDEREPVGAGEFSFFETMVFPTLEKQDEGNEGCGCHEVADWGGIDGRRTATAGDAARCHEEMVEKYIKIAEAAA